jgi:hypothetical protein
MCGRPGTAGEVSDESRFVVDASFNPPLSGGDSCGDDSGGFGFSVS